MQQRTSPCCIDMTMSYIFIYESVHVTEGVPLLCRYDYVTHIYSWECACNKNYLWLCHIALFIKSALVTEDADLFTRGVSPRLMAVEIHFVKYFIFWECTRDRGSYRCGSPHWLHNLFTGVHVRQRMSPGFIGVEVHLSHAFYLLECHIIETQMNCFVGLRIPPFRWQFTNNLLECTFSGQPGREPPPSWQFTNTLLECTSLLSWMWKYIILVRALPKVSPWVKLCKLGCQPGRNPHPGDILQIILLLTFFD